MPLLLPEQQFFLFTVPYKYDQRSFFFDDNFFSYFLSLANKSFNKDGFSFKIHNRFKKKFLLLKSFPFENIRVQINPNTNINNYYAFILSSTKKDEKDLLREFYNGHYCKAQFQSSNFNFFFFAFQLEYHWIYFDTSFIALTIHMPIKNEELLKIDLLIELLNASGFLVVLCILCDRKWDEVFLESIFKLLEKMILLKFISILSLLKIMRFRGKINI